MKLWEGIFENYIRIFLWEEAPHLFEAFKCDAPPNCLSSKRMPHILWGFKWNAPHICGAPIRRRLKSHPPVSVVTPHLFGGVRKGRPTYLRHSNVTPIVIAGLQWGCPTYFLWTYKEAIKGIPPYLWWRPTYLWRRPTY